MTHVLRAHFVFLPAINFSKTSFFNFARLA